MKETTYGTRSKRQVQRRVVLSDSKLRVWQQGESQKFLIWYIKKKKHLISGTENFDRK